MNNEINVNISLTPKNNCNLTLSNLDKVTVTDMVKMTMKNNDIFGI